MKQYTSFTSPLWRMILIDTLQNSSCQTALKQTPITN
jgi:hypothetical protein